MARARAQIIEFVRERALAGSDEVFTRKQLARFNAGRDDATWFQPYKTANTTQPRDDRR